MDFQPWLQTLISDANRTGCLDRFRGTTALWHQVYLKGVQPTIIAVCAWATESPARFEYLRFTEPGLIERILQEDEEEFQMAA